MSQGTIILIVDDEPFGREALAALLQPYHVVLARNGVEALEQAAATLPDLILLDVMMPGMDGYEVCRRLRAASTPLAEVPIIMVTALDDRDSRLEGIDAGADDFISKPYDSMELRVRIRAITRLNRYRRLLHERSKFERVIEFMPNGLLILAADGTIQLANPAMFRMLGVSAGAQLIGTALHAYVAPNECARISDALHRVCSDPACVMRFESVLLRPDDATVPVEIDAGYIEWDGQPAAQIAIRDITELAVAYDATIEGWSHAMDLRDRETEGHTLRVTEMTERLARMVGITEAEMIHIRRGALLHDIGKIGVPDSILRKPGPLTDEEWAVMREHPQLAYEMLAPIRYLAPALDIPYCHHEKWDGSGYPRGLAGTRIPLAARIFAVVDVWDALRSDRPYRSGWTEEKTLEHIRTLAGTHFEPSIVELFLRLRNSDRSP